MKKRRMLIVSAAAVVLALALILRWVSRPSNRNTRAFFSRHQELLDSFIALCRTEAKDKGLCAVYTDSDGGTLMCDPVQWMSVEENEFPASSELCSLWERIKGCRYFTSVGCSFDENGAMKAEFSARGEWIRYEMGNYCVCHCLLWRDSDYSGRALDDYWAPLEESSEQGRWYYTSHKHYDG